MKINELISTFEIFTTNEETKLLEKLKKPVLLSHLNDHDQYVVETMIRKSLVKKIGFKNPTVVANEKAAI
jgi:hypothetical protein